MRRPLDVARIAETLARRWVGEEALRLERLRAVWTSLVGQTVARRTHPARLDGATLWIHVHDEQWLHEMRWLRQPLLDRLGAAEVGRGITSLEFRRGPVPPPSARAPSPLDGAATPASQGDSMGHPAQATPRPTKRSVAADEPRVMTGSSVASDETLPSLNTMVGDAALREALLGVEDPELRSRLLRLVLAAERDDPGERTRSR